jgi:hypothetical protein
MSIRIWLSDDSGTPREAFSIGQTVFVSGRGLRLAAPYEFKLLPQTGDGKPKLIARYTTDRHGELAMTALLPYVGLLQGEGSRTRTYPEAQASLGPRMLVIRVMEPPGSEPEFEDMRFAIMLADREPRLFSCDPLGRLQTGIEQGAGQVAVALRNFPAGCIRIFLVRRQFGWRIGDPIEPVGTRGAAIIRTVDHDGSAMRILMIARSAELEQGSYQFIARAFPPGWYAADEHNLLAGDVVSDRRFA